MKAKLLPLKGKYYGTEVHIEDDHGNDYTINLWHSGSWEPSDREIAGECRIEEWRKDKRLYEICDNHFESRETFALACTIVELINGKADERG